MPRQRERAARPVGRASGCVREACGCAARRRGLRTERRDGGEAADREAEQRHRGVEHPQVRREGVDQLSKHGTQEARSGDGWLAHVTARKGKASRLRHGRDEAKERELGRGDRDGLPKATAGVDSLVGKEAITDKKVAGLGFTGICFTGALIMIGFGYLGEAGLMSAIPALLLGGMGWAMIVVATGTPWTDGLGVDNSKISEELMWSANALRWFIVVGWIIYPLGYLFSPEVALIEIDNGAEIMAVAYNIADIINKIGFGVVAWMGAKKATEVLAAE